MRIPKDFLTWHIKRRNEVVPILSELEFKICPLKKKKNSTLDTPLICVLSIWIRVVVEAGTSETETETWVAETKTETEAI